MYCFCSYCDSAVVRNVLRVYRNDMLIASPPPFSPKCTQTLMAFHHPLVTIPTTHPAGHSKIPKHTCGGKILSTNSPHCKHTVVDTATGNRLTEMLLCLEAKQTETTHPQQSSVSLTTSTWCIENSLSVTSCRGWKSPYKYSCLAKQLVIFVLNKENPILLVQRQRKQ